MVRRRGARGCGWLLGPALIIVAGCSAGNADSAASETITTTTVAVEPTTPEATTTVPTTSAVPSTTESLVPAPPACTLTVQAGDGLGKLAVRAGLTIDELRAENRLNDDHVLHPGDELDICLGDDVDEIAGASLVASSPAAVMRQQRKLNELFAPYRFIDLVIDGDSGPLTRQLLCTARMGLGMPISGAHMAAGSEQEAQLFAATSISLPDGRPGTDGKWILIDKTCQVMFTGEGDQLVNIYPTSTGEEGHETTNVNGVRAFRFNPALETDGWHDSTSFPVEADNPLNGNMYKPIYFNDGEAIHGAGFVPPSPRSKGCARTFPLHQDEIIRWLGLDQITSAIWQTSTIGLRVSVQGEYQPLD